MQQQESDHERRRGSIDFAGEVSGHKQKERLPFGQRRYRTSVILRPDITEEERLDWTQRYNEVSGGLHLSFMYYTRFSLFSQFKASFFSMALRTPSFSGLNGGSLYSFKSVLKLLFFNSFRVSEFPS